MLALMAKLFDVGDIHVVHVDDVDGKLFDVCAVDGEALRCCSC